jgi:hypothetical protein
MNGRLVTLADGTLFAAAPQRKIRIAPGPAPPT